MRISGINNNINFGRVIEIRNMQAPEHSKHNAKEIASVLKGVPSLEYTDEEAEKMISFFEDIDSDYKAYSPVIARKTKFGFTVLATGKDAREIEKIEETYRTERNSFKHGSLKKQINLEQQQEERDKYINSRMENGIDDRPNSIILLRPDKYSDIKASRIDYLSSVETTSVLDDGHVLSDEECRKRSIEEPYFTRNISFESKTLDFEA